MDDIFGINCGDFLLSKSIVLIIAAMHHIRKTCGIGYVRINGVGYMFKATNTYKIH